jgi:hypothetical protein
LPVFTKEQNDFSKIGIVIDYPISMKEAIFYIILNTKTASGVECIGKFFIGNDRRAANRIFRTLKGVDVDDKTVLSFELMEAVNGLPINIKMISCTLEELADNCRSITKELFKMLNLEELL